MLYSAVEGEAPDNSLFTLYLHVKNFRLLGDTSHAVRYWQRKRVGRIVPTRTGIARLRVTPLHIVFAFDPVEHFPFLANKLLRLLPHLLTFPDQSAEYLKLHTEKRPSMKRFPSANAPQKPSTSSAVYRGHRSWTSSREHTNLINGDTALVFMQNLRKPALLQQLERKVDLSWRAQRVTRASNRYWRSAAFSSSWRCSRCWS